MAPKVMGRWLTAAVVATVVMLGVAGPAVASEAKNTQIGGVGTFVPDVPGGECTTHDDFFTLKMTGSLVGCWYTTVLDVVQETPSGIYQERGVETFEGCLVEDGVPTACGSFTTTYHFNAKFAPDGSEIHGRCLHPIVSGTEDFEGATGRVDFKDDVTTGEYHYRGHIKLG